MKRFPQTFLFRERLACCLAALIALCIGACNINETPKSDRPVVAVSVLPLAFVVDRIADGEVEVEVMIPPGASPALYEPAMDKMQALARASVYVKVGHPDFPFEIAWLDRLTEGRENLSIVDSSAGVDRLDEDPHVWLAPAQMTGIARNVHAALVEELPEHRKRLDRNLAGLLAEIDAAAASCRKILAPARGRRFFVFHPAWGYFARAFGLTQVAIEEHGKEPDAHHIGELVHAAEDAGVEVIFTQPQMSEASAKLVADEIGARLEVLDPLAYDWPGNLKSAARAIAMGAVP